MWELLTFWPALGPLGRALTLALTGLAIGSFLSVLRHRLPLRQDPWQGRSQCPACSQTLGPAELVPVLSYLIQRGRCKHCRAPIPPIYPLLELGTALIAGAGGLVSWTAGLAVLGALIGLTWAINRPQFRRVTKGFMLTEVLVALLLFALTIGSVLQVFGIALHAVPAGQRRTQAVAIARAHFSTMAQGLYGQSKSAVSYCNGERLAAEAEYTGADVLFLEELSIYLVTVDFDPLNSNSDQCLGVTVTVSCPTCKSKYGEALVPVVVRGSIRKRLLAGG